MFESKLNIDSETKEWIDESIEWVINNLGYEYLKTKNDVKPWDILKKK